jgi:septal ring factor EnvC (AmiA/AmiB activator)
MTKEECLNSDFVKMAHLNNQVGCLKQENKKLRNEIKKLHNEKRKLKQQIEKMKNCKNCEHYETTKDYGVCRDKCAKNKKGQWILTNWKLYKD